MRLSTLFNVTNIIHKTTSVSRKTKDIIHNVKDFSGLYNNAVRSVIYEGWHFTHMWKSLVWLHHFTKKGDLVHNICLIPPRFIKVPVPARILPLSTILIFDLGIVPTLWYLCFSFYHIKLYHYYLNMLKQILRHIFMQC